MKLNNCYEVNNIIYFRKKIPLCNKIYRVSLRKLLGKSLYHNYISKSYISNFINYLNNQLDIFFMSKKEVLMEELNQFVKALLLQYKQKATIIETEDITYIDNIGSFSSQVEEKRFKDIAYYEEDGTFKAGHTYDALQRETNLLREDFNSNSISKISNSAKRVLNRQDIITEEELDKIPQKLQVPFFEALLKIEMEVLAQDIKNYEHNTGYTPPRNNLNENDIIQKVLSQLNQGESSFLKQHLDTNNDNWELLINEYLLLKESEGRAPNTIRTLSIDLNIFKKLMLGDMTYNINKKNLLDCGLNEVLELKEKIKILPDFRKKEIKKYKDRNIYFRINKAINDNLEQISFSGMGSKVKSIKAFIKFLHDTNPVYKELNVKLWDKLVINESSLNTEQKIQKDKDIKLPLESKVLNDFLLQRYPNTSQGIKNFKVHTDKSAHIFWGTILAIYTGARAEELAQLRVTDFYKTIINDKPIYSFKILVTDYENQSIKNNNSKRAIPIHPNIIKLGFLNYLKKRIQLKCDYVFSLGINQDGKRKHFQSSWNRSFKEFYQKGDFEKGKEPTFHSLRDHFITKYLQHNNNEQRFNEVNLKKLTGHGEKNIIVDNYYKENIDIKFAYDLISSIDFKIDKAQAFLEDKINKCFAKPIEDIELVNKTIVL